MGVGHGQRSYLRGVYRKALSMFSCRGVQHEQEGTQSMCRAGHGSFSWSSAPVLYPLTIIPSTLKLGRNFPSPFCFLTSLLALLKTHQTGGSSDSADTVGAGTSGGVGGTIWQLQCIAHGPSASAGARAGGVGSDTCSAQ